MNGIKQIFQKEMARIFRDKKMVFSVFILPVAIMIGILMVTTLVYLIQCCFGHIQLKKILSATARGIWLK